MKAVSPSLPQSMVSQGSPSRSMVAIELPSSTASALPTPWKRSAQPMASVSLRPARVVGLAQAGEVRVHSLGGPLAAKLEQRAFQARQVARAPSGFGQALAAAVQVDHPALAVLAEQDVVGVEVDVVEPAAMAARDELARLLPRRLARGSQVGQAAHAEQALDQDRGAVERAAAHVAGRHRRGNGKSVAPQFTQQAELHEAARAVAAAPEVQVAAEPGHQPAPQVVAEHRMPERAFYEPRAAAPAGAHRLGAITPVPWLEPAPFDLPRDRRIAQNRAVPTACNAEWRQAFAGVESDHPASLASRMANPTRSQAASPPASICLLRLSALGDVTHVLPLVHTLRDAWPDVALTWVIGQAEQRL